MPSAAFAPRFIAVEGVIGVGKTTLVNELAAILGGRKVFEEFEQNPFLEDFYRDRQRYAFSTQIFFLMARFRQQEILAQGDLFQKTTFSDYLFDKDRIFAQLTLASDELALYERLFSVLRLSVPKPDRVVYLFAEPKVILRRIAARGRHYETNMDPEYMVALSAAYQRFFAEYRTCPVLTVDTTDLDLREDRSILLRIVEALQAGAPGLGEPKSGPQEAFSFGARRSRRRP